MKKLAFALALAVAVFGVAVTISTDQQHEIAFACQNC
jgi:hypothetical protein